MRTRTVKKSIEKNIKKEVKKTVDFILADFINNKKGLIEVYGLIKTNSLHVKEFEETSDFWVTDKKIKTAYTKFKNDLGRLYYELQKREEMKNIQMIEKNISILTRAKLLNKFEELRKIEKEYIKTTKEKLPTASEIGIPQLWFDFFNNLELITECIKDYIDYDTFTNKEKHYMKRYVTYATKYIKMIEDEY